MYVTPTKIIHPLVRAVFLSWFISTSRGERALKRLRRKTPDEEICTSKAIAVFVLLCAFLLGFRQNESRPGKIAPEGACLTSRVVRGLAWRAHTSWEHVPRKTPSPVAAEGETGQYCDIIVLRLPRSSKESFGIVYRPPAPASGPPHTSDVLFGSLLTTGLASDYPLPVRCLSRSYCTPRPPRSARGNAFVKGREVVNR